MAGTKIYVATHVLSDPSTDIDLPEMVKRNIRVHEATPSPSHLCPPVSPLGPIPTEYNDPPHPPKSFSHVHMYLFVYNCAIY